MAYDAVRRESVLFGGWTGGYSGETWVLDATGWHLRPAPGPGPREDHAMVFDSARGVVVLYGGDVGGSSGETWEWNGTAWTLRATTGPGPRHHHAMAYDSGRGVTVLFGGSITGGDFFDDTWEWDGAAWSQHAPGNRPSPRLRHAMAYDSARGVTVLFGGNTANGASGETWTWDGTDWALRQVAPAPAPRGWHSMSFDSARGVTVLFGGYPGPSSAETWEWDGAVWTQSISPGPGPRYNHAQAFDSDTSKTVLFGGQLSSAGFYYDDTWLFPGCDAPTANAGPDQWVVCTAAAGSLVTLDGSGSTGSCGAGLTYTWTGSFPEGGGVATGVSPSVTLPLGRWEVTLVVSQGGVASTPDTVAVTVTAAADGLEAPMGDLVPDGQSPPLPPHAFRRGRTIPLKFRLLCGGEVLTDAQTGPPMIAGLQCLGSPVPLGTIDPDPGAANDNGLFFRYSDGWWVYNLSTAALPAGTYVVMVQTPDGARRNAVFVLR